MCGRFSLTASGEEVAEAFDLDDVPDLSPRYNIAPSQEVAVIRAVEGKKHLSLMRWGFVPAGAPVERTVINARAESAPTRGAFREAFARRRCLVPADGFYEWQAVGGERKKRPHHVRPAQGGLLALAGLWQPASDDHGALTLLTTEPNLEMRGIHDRMPVIVARAAFTAWLDPEARVDALVALMQPAADGTLRATPVGFTVNDARAEGPACLLPPVEEPPRQGELPWGKALE